MRLGDIAKLKPRTEQVLIGEIEGEKPVYLVLRAPRLAEVQTVDREIAMPEAPVLQEVERHPKTGEAIKDANGRPILKRDTRDPAYQDRLRRAGRAQSLALIVSCLDGSAKFDTKRESFGNPVDYYDALWTELEEFGLDLAAFRALVEASQRLAGLKDGELAAARKALGKVRPSG